MTSASAASSASTRSSWCTPTAAPTRSRPWPSRQASGKRSCLAMSLIVMRPVRRPSPSTSSSFSTFCSLRIVSASGSVVPGPPVISRVLITSDSGVSSSERKSMSRRVTMPTTRPLRTPPSVIGTPEMFCVRISERASEAFAVGGSTCGSGMTPLADRFTLVTSRAWASTERFLWMTPRPPSWARPMASCDSVTVSIGADTSGTFSVRFRVSGAEVSTSPGMKSLKLGSSSRSSKVMPSERIRASPERSFAGSMSEGNRSGNPRTVSVLRAFRRRSADSRR